MGTIEENTTSRTVNCDRSASCKLIRNRPIARLLQQGTVNSEAFWPRCARLLSVFRCIVKNCRCDIVKFRGSRILNGTFCKIP